MKISTDYKEEVHKPRYIVRPARRSSDPNSPANWPETPSGKLPYIYKKEKKYPERLEVIRLRRRNVVPPPMSVSSSFNMNHLPFIGISTSP